MVNSYYHHRQQNQQFGMTNPARPSLRFIIIITITLHQSFDPANGFTFNCIGFGKCVCDTNKELIDCRNQSLGQFPIMSSKLKGFSVLSLMNNNISSRFMVESKLLRLLPDLQIIDLTNNPNLDCNRVGGMYRRVNIISNCISRSELHNVQNKFKGLNRMEWRKPQPATEKKIARKYAGKLCGFMCQLETKVAPTALNLYSNFNTKALTNSINASPGFKKFRSIVKSLFGFRDAMPN